MAEITIKLGDHVVQTQAFSGDLLRIGRSRENDVVLENLSVSRHHVQIRLFEGNYVLFDMNSSNGTYLNGVRITRRELQHGDAITIGKHVLLWSDQSEAATMIVTRELPPDAPAKVAPRGSNRSEAWVKVESGTLKDREFGLVRFETTIGKSPKCDVVLNDDWLLSKQQAIILRKGNDEFEVEDLGGIRRVKVNGKAIERATTLRTGDKLEIGVTRMTFYSTASEHRTTPAQMLLKSQPAAEAADQEEDLDQTGRMGPLDSPAAEEFALEQSFVPPLQEMAGLSEQAFEQHLVHAGQHPSSQQSAGQRHSTADSPPDVYEAAKSPSAATPQPQRAMVEIHEDDSQEVKMWKAALESSSPAIRRQAARILKKLTGRDYDV